MSTSAPLSGLPLPEDDDVLDANATFGQYAQGADTMLIPRYADVAARNAAMAAGKQAGMMCTVNSGPQYYDGTTWNYLENYLFARKTAATARATAAAPTVADPHLTLPLLGNSVYEVRVSLFTTAADIGQIWVSTWGLPVGASATRFVMAPQLAAWASESPQQSAALLCSTTGEEPSYASSDAGPTYSFRFETGLVTTVGAGSLTLNWRTVSATSTVTLEIDSFMVARRVLA